MSIVSLKTRNKIKEGINNVEQQSSCELVAVLSKESHNYAFLLTMIAAFSALITPAILMIFGMASSLLIYQIQVVVFVLLYLLFNVNYILYAILPARYMKKKASQRAKESFVSLGLHQTKNQQSVMIFVSLFEHYVEIIADVGVREKLSNETWQEIINDFTTDVKNGNFEIGYLKAIESIRKILIESFPRSDDSDTILPNRLIEI